MQIVEPDVSLLDMTANPIALIEGAARQCYQTTGNKGRAFVDMLIARGHFSPLEFPDATLLVTTSRSIGNEAVRHRLCSFAQESTRFCNYVKDRFGGEIRVIDPGFLHEKTREEWLTAMSILEDVYMRAVARGEPAELAREVLPLCLKTTFAWKANFREWRQVIFPQRRAPAAHPHMRVLMDKALTVLSNACPDFPFV